MRWMLTWLVAGSLVACTPDEDVDGDGFLASQDCNDNNADVNPDATETIADGIDANCDGFELCYVDADGDQFGTEETALSTNKACSQTGFAANADDCNDESAAAAPGLEEIPGDGLDNDCDGQELCFTDDDGDGFGTDPVAADSCDAPGLAPEAGDCDDASDSIYPGAPDEPDDGIDSDCDGLIGCFMDSDGDGFGADPIEVEECGPGQVEEGGDCDDTDPSVNPDATESAGDGIDSDCDGNELCYVDADGDGFGTSDTDIGDAACAGTGFATNEDDCDDDAVTVFPGAVETAADGVDSNCDGFEDCYADGDGDGFGIDTLVQADLTCSDAGAASANGDCDDASDAAFPGATESPADGVDADCDGQELCYVDSDGDSFGEATTSPGSLLCDDVGVASNSDDCDDTTATAFPGGTEQAADGIDGDCDGQELCYIDGDGDGYGNSGTQPGSLACDDAGVAPNSDDCDDALATTFPGAVETAADNIDSDCDGQELCYVDGDGDGFGSMTTDSGPIDCTGFATEDTDCDDTDPDVFPGATEVCDGVDNDCDPATTETGMAHFRFDDGTMIDYTADFAMGTPTAPASFVSPGPGELQLCDGTFDVSLFILAQDVRVTGAGRDETILDGSGNHQLLYALGVDGLEVSDLTLTNGFSSSGQSQGGAVEADSSSMTFERVAITNSTAAYGAAMYLFSVDLTATDSVFSDNAAGFGGTGFGGVAFVTGSVPSSVTFVNSTFDSNTADDVGAGSSIHIFPGNGTTLTVTDSTFTAAPADANSQIVFGSAFDPLGLVSFTCDVAACPVP